MCLWRNKKFIFFTLLVIVILAGKYFSRHQNNDKFILPINYPEASSLNNQTNDNFSNFKKKREKLALKPQKVSLISVGDISFSRGVERMVKFRQNINYPFLKIKDYFSSADFVFANLETPITPGREIKNNEMLFRSNPGTEKALKTAGFTILSLANNHTPNFGAKGLKDTTKYLDQVGIKYAGAGQNEQQANQPVYFEKKGIKFALLAYNDPSVVPPSYEAGENHSGTAFMRQEKMVKAVKKAKQKADLVIVSMHSGYEYVNDPNDFQKKFSHSAIDAGAEIVIGHHPHVIQKMEQYKNKYIFYSLGNFVMDQMWSLETKESLIIKIYFNKQGVTKVVFLPMIIEDFCQPRKANQAEAKKILARLGFPLVKAGIYYWNKQKNGLEMTLRKAVYSDNFSSISSQISKQESADLNKDSQPETYSLIKGQMTIKQKGKQIWQSPDNWWIDDFILADSTNDGIVDFNLSVWKAGSYGNSKPFWQENNDLSVKNHFFIFDLDGDKIKPVWQSSNLDAFNQEFAISDIDGDGINELITIEVDYENKQRCENNYLAVWQWNDWGFSNKWRSKKGNFCQLEIEAINGKKYVSTLKNRHSESPL